MKPSIFGIERVPYGTAMSASAGQSCEKETKGRNSDWLDQADTPSAGRT